MTWLLSSTIALVFLCIGLTIWHYRQAIPRPAWRGWIAAIAGIATAACLAGAIVDAMRLIPSPPDDTLVAGKEKDWKAGFQHAYQRGVKETGPERKPVAEPPPKPPTPPPVLVQQKPFWVDPDGVGGGKVTVRVPAANLVRTGLTFRRGEAFYISTPNYVANLQVGTIRKVNGQEVVVWIPVPATEFWSMDQPHRMRLGSAPEAELCFGTAAVPPGTYRVHVRKSAGPVGPLEYTPGVPLGRVLY